LLKWFLFMKFSLGLFILCIATVSGLATAQQLYKCGNTYSQIPCAADAAPKKVFSSSAPAKAAGSTGYELCAAHAVKTVLSPEPETARTAAVGQRKAEVIQYAGQSIVSQRFDLTVDAKTQYGVYSGPIAYACWLSEDQARVLQFRRNTGGG
jgi:hypothetical protein